jgi:hypothetical protein
MYQIAPTSGHRHAGRLLEVRQLDFSLWLVTFTTVEAPMSGGICHAPRIAMFRDDS